MTRNQKIVAFKEAHPCITMAEIGRHYGLTRERVRQIIKKETGISYGQITKPRRLCLNCGQSCKKLGYTYCSTACHNEARRVTLKCYTAGRCLHADNHTLSVLLNHRHIQPTAITAPDIAPGCSWGESTVGVPGVPDTIQRRMGAGKNE